MKVVGEARLEMPPWRWLLVSELVEWQRKEDQDGVQVWAFKTNLELLSAPVQNELQHILDYARLALVGIETMDAVPDKTPESFLQVHPAMNRRLPVEVAKREAAGWIVRGAFRDAMETVHYVLDETRHVLALWSLHGKAFKGEDYNARVLDGQKRFKRMGLPEKFAALEGDGFQVDARVVNTVLGLQRLRNSIVHNFGTTLPGYADEAGALEVAWHQYMLCDDKGQSRPIARGLVTEAGTRVSIQMVLATRRFPAGQPIQLTLDDLNGICNTLHNFALVLGNQLRERKTQDHLP